ncbi:hypothetical protein LO761_02160 [Bacteroidaceae bacterium 14-104]|nr:hypothetical protein [Phocaeicola oris]MCE2615718.1 hypothetical protein [Phocaeicola oris]
MERIVYRARTLYVLKVYLRSQPQTERKPNGKILEDCGMVMGRGVHSTLPDEQINWAFDTHPEERIIETTEKP